MQICFIINDISKGRGSERVAITVANNLALSSKVTFISLNRESCKPFFEVSKAINIVQIKPLAKSFVPVKLSKKFTELKAIQQSVNENQFDVLIGVGSYPSILLGTLGKLGFLKGLRIIGWEHANLSPITSPLWRRIRMASYSVLDGLVCLNETDVNDFRHFSKRVISIPNPLSFKSPVVSELRQKIIVSLGALEPEKGFDLLISAFKDVAVKSADWQLIILGEGSEKQNLEAQILDLGLEGKVFLKPPVKNTQIEYLAASLYVLPSRREGFGLVLIEAMECGLPCISFDCPTGPRSIISHNENGILVPSEDAVALTEAIVSLIQDRERMRRLARAGKALVQKYYPENVVDQWKVWLEVIVK